jgi:hypothetical protein
VARASPPGRQSQRSISRTSVTAQRSPPAPTRSKRRTSASRRHCISALMMRFIARNRRALAAISWNSSRISSVRMPCRQLPWRRPRGAPPLPPCMRQTRLPRIAG